MQGTSCLVVLIGAQTAGRNWINYEIEKAWRERKGIAGIFIHKLQDQAQRTTQKGENPFKYVSLPESKNQHRGLGALVKMYPSQIQCYDPSGINSQEVYNEIKISFQNWVEQAVRNRLRTGL